MFEPTLKDQVATLIDNSWIYSMHWKDDTWLKQAKEDLQTEYEYARKRIENLNYAARLLSVHTDSQFPLD